MSFCKRQHHHCRRRMLPSVAVPGSSAFASIRKNLFAGHVVAHVHYLYFYDRTTGDGEDPSGADIGFKMRVTAEFCSAGFTVRSRIVTFHRAHHEWVGAVTQQTIALIPRLTYCAVLKTWRCFTSVGVTGIDGTADGCENQVPLTSKQSSRKRFVSWMEAWAHRPRLSESSMLVRVWLRFLLCQFHPDSSRKLWKIVHLSIQLDCGMTFPTAKIELRGLHDFRTVMIQKYFVHQRAGIPAHSDGTVHSPEWDRRQTLEQASEVALPLQRRQLSVSGGRHATTTILPNRSVGGGIPQRVDGVHVPVLLGGFHQNSHRDNDDPEFFNKEEPRRPIKSDRVPGLDVAWKVSKALCWPSRMC